MFARFVIVAAACLSTVAIVLGIHGALSGAPSAATPIHQANVFFDGVSRFDFRQACTVVYIPSATAAQCGGYFTQTTALAGAHYAHAVPHSEKIDGDKATVRGAGSDGTTYTVTEQLRRGVWRLTSVTSP